MRPFIKKKFPNGRLSAADALSECLRKGSEKAARRLAHYLSQKEQRLSLQTKKLLLAAFFLAVSVYAGFLIYQSFAGPPGLEQTRFLRQPDITPPALGRLPDSLTLRLIRRQAALEDSSFPHH